MDHFKAFGYIKILWLFILSSWNLSFQFIPQVIKYPLDYQLISIFDPRGFQSSPFTYKLIPWLSGRLNFSIDLLVILVMSVHFMINALDYQCIYLTSASKLLNFLAIPLIISGFPWLSFDPLSHPTGFYWSVLSLNSVYPTNVFPSLSSLNHEGEGPLLI